MGDREYAFLEDMRNKRIDFCTDQVDRKWERSMIRKKKREERLEEKSSVKDNETMRGEAYEVALHEYREQDGNDFVDDPQDMSFEEETVVSDSESGSNEVRKKRRKIFVGSQGQSSKDELPTKFQHIRVSERVVRREFYKLVDM